MLPPLATSTKLHLLIVSRWFALRAALRAAAVVTPLDSPPPQPPLPLLPLLFRLKQRKNQKNSRERGKIGR